MFDRATSRQLETLFAREGSNTDRIARHANGLLLLLQSILTALVTVKGLWDNGFAQRLAGEDGARLVNGLTLRQWHQYSAAFLVYAVFMKMPLAAMAALSLPDGTRPFAVFNPAQLGELANMSFEQIAFSEPETNLPAAEVVEQPIIEEEI